MFTGIITDLGKFIRRKSQHYFFQTDKSVCRKLSLGSSIAINGVCLTVREQPAADMFSVIVMNETIKKTVLGSLSENDLVNLELPVTPDSFLAGHMVQGHIDGIGTISDIVDEGNSKLLKIYIPKELSKYIVKKGSVAVNGISLTVIEVKNTGFSVGIIPHTWTHTMLQKIKIGDRINLETDVIGKYVERFLSIGDCRCGNLTGSKDIE